MFLSVLLIAFGAALLCTVLFPFVLAACGFRELGIEKHSLASKLQALAYRVSIGKSVVSSLQSAGMRGQGCFNFYHYVFITAFVWSELTIGLVYYLLYDSKNNFKV